jgi:hypothetical protein
VTTAPLPATSTSTIPWYVKAVLFASTSVVIGVIWDISWHRTIGRDTFWTPAHMAIYTGGVVAGLSCGWLVLKMSFAGTPAERDQGVSFWHWFRGPIGAWVCIWGSFAMITSAPFDDWWHNAYGLDVKIISPPHSLLALGIGTIAFGALLMVLAQQNRATAVAAPTTSPGPAARLYVYGAGIILLLHATMSMEYLGYWNHAHDTLYYKVAGGAFPIVLIAGARASKVRWPATATALVYMGLTLLMVWGLPLFPAQARLGPIYNPVTHMVAPPFPMLLVLPALAIDVLMRRLGSGRDWTLSVVLGLAFLTVFFLVQWFGAYFFLTPAARNIIFSGDSWDYSTRIRPSLYSFWNPSSGKALAVGLVWALGISVVSSRAGLWMGNWMARVKR